MPRHSRTSKSQPSAFDLLTSFPWWVSVLVGFIGAGFFWLILPSLTFPGAATNPIASGIDGAIHAEPIRKLGIWASLLIGAVGAIVSYANSLKRSKLLDKQQGIESIKAMSWQEFELLVGECYRRQSYSVTETGKDGPDGGIDLILRKQDKKVLVQCKQWQTYSVGVSIVREMFGLMVHHEASSVVIVTCGKFTVAARDFAKGKPIELVDGEKLLSMVRNVQDVPTQPLSVTR